MATRRRAVPSLEPIMQLIERGHARLEGNELIGIAADGVEVSLGYMWECAHILRYLADYPTPDKW